MLLEVCAYNIESCLTAEKAGAGRIELCANPAEGGVTPSAGMIAYAMEMLVIPVYPMIRPRGGNFSFSADELEIMERDIRYCKALGCRGIATGINNSDGTIDVDWLRRLVELAYPMEVTCHKVFDKVPDAATALEQLIEAGCTRVLTSGLGKTAPEGAGIIKQLIAQADGRIAIMPGGGVRSSNIKKLMYETGAMEYHSSCITDIRLSQIANSEEVTLLVNAMK